MSPLPCLIAACLMAQAPKDADQRMYVNAIKDAYIANRATFPFGSIKFRFVRGITSSESAARSGKFDTAYTAAALYYFNGTSARYERIYKDDDMRAANKRVGDTTTSIIESTRCATNGQVALEDERVLSDHGDTRKTLLAPAASFDDYFRFPLSLGRPDVQNYSNLDFVIPKDLRDSDPRIKYLKKNVDYEGSEVVNFSIEVTAGAMKYSIESWIDLKQGAVPRKMIYRDAEGEAQMVIYLDDVRYIPGHGWLPFKESWLSIGSDKGGQILVDEASFDTPPKESDFEIAFAEPVPLPYAEKSLRYPPQRVWNVLRMPGSHSRGVEKIQFSSIPSDAVPKFPGERPASSPLKPLLYGIAAVLITAVMIYWRRRQTHG